MIVQAFLRWAGTAATGQRVRAAEALAEAYVAGSLSGEDRHAAEAAMMFLLDDPSPKVRLALAHVLAPFPDAPRALMCALAQDQVEVATLVLSCSGVLVDADLIDLVADDRPAVQRAIASRLGLSRAVSAALAEVGCREAVGELLDNAHAAIAAVSLRRILERFGTIAEIRAQLLDRHDLPGDLRHELMVSISDALSSNGLVTATIGAERLRRVTNDACRSATLRLAADTMAADLPALAEHLRIRGRLTPSFLMDALCRGHVDFFLAAIVSLSGSDERRVRAILVDGGAGSMRALFRKAAIPADLNAIFVDAVTLWRAAGRESGRDAPTAIPQRLITRHAEAARRSPLVADLLVLVERFGRAALRDDARRRANAAIGYAA